MNYKEFTQRVKQHLLSRPGYASPPASIQENSRDLIIMFQEQQIPLKLEIESYYGIYQYGVPFEEVLKAIETAAEKKRNHIAEDQKMVRDYKQAKELLTVELVNAEEKKEILKKIPHKMIGDMALDCRMNFKNGYTLHVGNKRMQEWGITEEQLFSDALQNASHIEPPILVEKADNGLIRYVYTNQSSNNGVSLIVYPDFLDELARKLNDNLIIIIPSATGIGIIEEKRATSLRVGDWNAIHEVMTKTAEGSASIITKHTFHYDKKEKILETMEAYENRMSQKLVNYVMKMMGPTM